MKNTLASCKYIDCKSKDACKRYNIDTAEINFKAYYENDKCDYFIAKDETKVGDKNE